MNVHDFESLTPAQILCEIRRVAMEHIGTATNAQGCSCSSIRNAHVDPALAFILGAMESRIAAERAGREPGLYVGFHLSSGEPEFVDIRSGRARWNAASGRVITCSPARLHEVFGGLHAYDGKAVRTVRCNDVVRFGNVNGEVVGITREPHRILVEVDSGGQRAFIRLERGQEYGPVQVRADGGTWFTAEWPAFYGESSGDVVSGAAA